MQINGPTIASVIAGQQQEAQITAAISQAPRQADQQAQETQQQSEIANPVLPVNNADETRKPEDATNAVRGGLINITV
jgi:hypothetical protein